jgi:hypothetical protein
MGRFPLKDYWKALQSLPEGYLLILDSDAGVAQRDDEGRVCRSYKFGLLNRS